MSQTSQHANVEHRIKNYWNNDIQMCVFDNTFVRTPSRGPSPLCLEEETQSDDNIQTC